jgi:hypothetical protein
MRKFAVVETDNFGGDYPNETFAGPMLTEEEATKVADIFNNATHENHSRFWKVVKFPYKLLPGFEP